MEGDSLPTSERPACFSLGDASDRTTTAAQIGSTSTALPRRWTKPGNACHEVKDCLDCHDGVKKVEGLHPADWVMTHGFEAQRRGLDCQACHDVETDCQSCHEDAGLKPGLFPGGPAATEDQGIRFHPQGWAGTVERSGVQSTTAMGPARA